MRIFDFNDYKEFVNEYLKAMPNNGRGQFQSISKFLNCHSTLISQIFRGHRDLNLEQAIGLADYLNFSQKEKRYFLTMVEFSRAGNHLLKKHFEAELFLQKKEAQDLENRLQVKKQLSEVEMARFYSDGIYSIIHLLTMIPDFQNEEALANKLGMPQETLSEILDFLISVGLIEKVNGLLKIGPSQTHLSKYSHFINSHHKNWRLNVIEIQKNRDENDFFYTGQIVMGREDFDKVKEMLAQTLERIYEVIGPSPCEDLYGLNIDYYQILKDKK